MYTCVSSRVMHDEILNEMEEYEILCYVNGYHIYYCV